MFTFKTNTSRRPPRRSTARDMTRTPRRTFGLHTFANMFKEFKKPNIKTQVYNPCTDWVHIHFLTCLGNTHTHACIHPLLHRRLPSSAVSTSTTSTTATTATTATAFSAHFSILQPLGGSRGVHPGNASSVHGIRNAGSAPAASVPSASSAAIRPVRAHSAGRRNVALFRSGVGRV